MFWSRANLWGSEFVLHTFICSIFVLYDYGSNYRIFLQVTAQGHLPLIAPFLTVKLIIPVPHSLRSLIFAKKSINKIIFHILFLLHRMYCNCIFRSSWRKCIYLKSGKNVRKHGKANAEYILRQDINIHRYMPHGTAQIFQK